MFGTSLSWWNNQYVGIYMHCSAALQTRSSLECHERTVGHVEIHYAKHFHSETSHNSRRWSCAWRASSGLPPMVANHRNSPSHVAVCQRDRCRWPREDRHKVLSWSTSSRWSSSEGWPCQIVLQRLVHGDTPWDRSHPRPFWDERSREFGCCAQSCAKFATALSQSGCSTLRSSL